MAEVQPPTFLAEGCYTPQQMRNQSVICSEGVDNLAGGDLRVTPAAAQPPLAVTIAGGRAWIQGDTVAGQGMYKVYSDGPKTVTLNTANPTDPRIDLIVAQVRDSQYAGTNDDWIITVVPGVASPAPVAPAVPASAIELARVTVPAAAGTIVAGNISDTRVQATICRRYLTEGLVVPSCRAQMAAGPVIATGSWYTPAWGVNFIVGGMTMVGRCIRVPKTGVYAISAQVDFGANGSGYRRMQILVNPPDPTTSGQLGGVLIAQTLLPPVNQAGWTTAIMSNVHQTLTAGDTVGAMAQQGSGVSLAIGASSPSENWFCVTYLGPTS